MNITFDKIDDLNAMVVINLEKADYSEKVDKELRRIQKNATMKGFRPGKAPLDMVKRLYGKSVLAEKIQQATSDALNQYIQDNKLDILGYPITSENTPSDIDIENNDSFSFAFDLGMAPAFELDFSAKDKLEHFIISVGDKEIDEDIEYARKRYGKLEEVEKAEAEDIIYANLTELNENGELLDGGIVEKPVSMVASLVEDKKTQKALLGSQRGAEMTVNIQKLFNGNEGVISSSLGIAREGVNDLNPNFKLVITDIKRRTFAELNEDYFKEVFGPADYPKTEAEYRERIKSNLENYYRNEADLWIDYQIGHLLMEKHKIQLPDAFLKRWLLATKAEHYNAENIEEKYAEEKSALMRRLVIDKIAEKYELKPAQEAILQEARTYYMGMYRQYGMNINPEDGFLDETIKKRMAEREFVTQMADRVIYRMAYDKVKETVTPKEKKVNVEDYFKHVNEHKHEHGE
ncbi:MAG: trigger factor [Bacteroidetes bacterium]|nr:trigger factor [Bacteroidota bacterium]